jgi:PTS system mannitol-specific IIC component
VPAAAPAPAPAAAALPEVPCSAASRDEAIDQAGALLVEVGAVEQSYVTAMHERELGSVCDPAGAATAVAVPAAAPAPAPAAAALPEVPCSTIRLDGRAASRDEAIDQAGALLVEVGAVEQSYVTAPAMPITKRVSLPFQSTGSSKRMKDMADVRMASTPEEILDIFGKVNS